ncbi:MAG: hypothetical protein AAB776_00930 [Patescibacteria group bacterium]
MSDLPRGLFLDLQNGEEYLLYQDGGLERRRTIALGLGTTRRRLAVDNMPDVHELSDADCLRRLLGIIARMENWIPTILTGYANFSFVFARAVTGPLENVVLTPYILGIRDMPEWDLANRTMPLPARMPHRNSDVWDALHNWDAIVFQVILK